MKQTEEQNNEQKQQTKNENTEQNKMELMPLSLATTLPQLYETEDIKIENKILQIRYISIFSNWEWYLVEYDKNEKIAFGYVRGFEDEWGYFSIEEFEQINMDSLQIIKEENFKPITFKQLKQRIKNANRYK